jgi:hypothetical protein
MHVLDPNLGIGDCLGNGLLLYCFVELHATNRVIACFLICNRNLACGEGTRLHCYDMISVTGEPGTTIITLGRLYFVLSCQLTTSNAAAVQHGRHAAARPQALEWVTPASEVGSEAFWTRLFSELLV